MRASRPPQGNIEFSPLFGKKAGVGFGTQREELQFFGQQVDEIEAIVFLCNDV